MADTCLINFTRWSTGGYIDVLLRETSAFGSYHWVNRIDTWNGVGNSFTHGTPTNPSYFHHSGGLISVLATNIQTGYGRIRIINRKGDFFFLCNAVHWISGKAAQTNPVLCHSDNVHGDPNSLSDARLKNAITPIAGTQALDILSQIQGAPMTERTSAKCAVG